MPLRVPLDAAAGLLKQLKALREVVG